MRTLRLRLLVPLSLLSFVGCFDPNAASDDELASTETGESEATSDDSTSDDSTSDDSTTDDSTTDDSTTDDSTTTDESTTGTGGDLPDGSACTSDAECTSANCYMVPLLGSYCGECTNDDDCDGGGCTAPNPFDPAPISTCNMGELGGGCESDEVCADGLYCGNVLDLLGLIKIDTCGLCSADEHCLRGQLCAPLVEVAEFSGSNDCVEPGSLPQDSFCLLEGNGDAVCQSGYCSIVNIMGIAEIGACGECQTDADCDGGTCMPGELVLDSGTLTGSICQ